VLGPWFGGKAGPKSSRCRPREGGRQHLRALQKGGGPVGPKSAINEAPGPGITLCEKVEEVSLEKKKGQFSSKGSAKRGQFS